MRPKFANKATIPLLVLGSAVSFAAIGALVGVLAVGQLESLPVSDNESMTVQLNHMFKQAVGLILGGLLGGIAGGLGATIFALVWRRQN